MKYLPLGGFCVTPHQIWPDMSTQEGNQILIEGKIFERDKEGLINEKAQDSTLEVYPEDKISFQSRTTKLASGTNISWSEIIEKISLNEKRLLGKLDFYRKD